MARLARIIVVNVPHHVTQRGNARQFLLNTDAERAVYLHLLRKHAELHELSLLGYCLMSNHVHLLIVPHKVDGLAMGLKQAHGQYASFWNATHQSSGHVWQGRFYSCPLDDAYLWIALRYVERNPVRARLVEKPEDWEWSSAADHCGCREPEAALQMELWKKRWTTTSWQDYLTSAETKAEVAAIRQNTHTGRPLGTLEFLKSVERATQRQLLPHKGGRPRKASSEVAHPTLPFLDKL